ncbi:NAD(P)/FAD-dependent oxidoreductase [Blastococcus sp. MG754426]|uniref:flavin-containing monooxygenase n=1 Tax=unclassified Blastococcus TaxID=2619396 RepID=UPI001EF014D6|nr:MULTISPECIES: NAD(P)/FAD-dependent oxidoreductase [unclassified Blastococcus]MCF6508290.1 NAD(P)/FAD-dependent oxidoreductase [Blastococcus sp. MG754426]MCF6512991.1 NAD(P)/FAD-dependent oxidoreductase [Blastococcus sp. MG754427]MCF6735709.1 NAD(P)/FAD-dependent oxidoreductase [Blastococcus sp. KM273129]
MTTEHLDVLIVGAGLSGIGAACHLERDRPGTSYALLESRAALGGTWDLFRYPGIRSDSDMFTLGYSFRPWQEPESIADGPAIRRYLEETAREHGVTERIRYHHRVVRAEWSSAEARWTVTAERSDTGGTVTLSCSWLQVCSGYYRYDQGFRPEFPGEERFGGQLVHPQHWPEDLDLTGKRVVVIGSGATAVTLVPNLAEQAAHVTMLQRTPSYVMSLPGRDALAQKLRARLPERTAYSVVRWKNVLTSTALYQLSRRRPALVRSLLRRLTQKQLPGFDVDTHFNPPYDPWDQRLCLVPDGDLFRALRRGTASIVTDRIASFTEDGIELASGERLPADVVVTATGLNLLPVGGMRIVVDGEPVELPERVSYKGMMLSGVPNFAMVIGYTNASWTLKADLVNRYVCRLLDHLDAHGYASATPVAPPEGGGAPFLDLAAGYVRRGLAGLPQQGRRAPWRLHQNYLRDVAMMRRGPLEDEGMTFQPRVPAAAGQVVA